MFLLFPRVIKIDINRRSKSAYKAVTHNNDGLTVVELLIAVAILVLVLAGGYTFFSFGWGTFDRGTSRAVAQNNLRMAAEAITNEVRYAGSLSIIDSTNVPDPVINDDFYIFVNNENRIVQRSATGSTVIPHELDSNLPLEVTFVRESDRMLKVVVKESGTDLELETEVRILNGTIADTAPNGNAIRVGSNGSGGNTEPVAVTGVTLSESSLTLQVGNNFTLTAQVQPSDATNKIVNWSSSNGTVAAVDSNGLVNGVSVGSATITVTTVDGNFQDACEIVVEVDSVPVTGVSLDHSSLLLIAGGDTAVLSETISPGNATMQNINWVSSDNSVATVQGGIVTPLMAGSAIITVEVNNAEFTDLCEITVVESEAALTVNETLNGIVSLDVSNAGNRNNQTKPKIILPAEVNGITFSFINSTATNNATISIPQGEVTRDENFDCTGTISLQASLGGYSKTKVLFVTIPVNHGGPAAVTVTELD